MTTNLPDPELKINVSNVDIEHQALVEITANMNLTGNVSVTVNGNAYSVVVTNGYGNYILPILPKGSYDAEAVFNGDDNFKPAVANATFNIDL